MEPLVLPTEPRTLTGKGAARQLRAKGLAPAVLYGPGIEPVNLAVSPKALLKVIMTPYRRNQLIELQVGAQKQLALVKELQVHPVTREVEHVDLYRVELSRAVRTDVPFQTEGRAKGVVAGGELYVTLRTLPVRCTPDKTPASISIDVSNLELGDTLRAKDLVLPAGVEVLLDGERNLVSCAEPRKIKAEEEAAAGAEGATPAAAAPAAS